MIDRLQFKRDYAGYLDRRRTHLYVQDVAPGEEHEAVQITSGDYDDSQPAWSPDGRLIAFVSNRTEEPDANSNSDIWVVAADNPDAGATLLQVTTNPGSDYSPAWSPDGSQIAHVTVTEQDLIWYATGHLAVSPAAGGPARVLSARLDRNVGSPRFAPDGETILFVLEDSAERHLASMDASGENFSRLIDGPLSLRGFFPERRRTTGDAHQRAAPAGGSVLRNRRRTASTDLHQSALARRIATRGSRERAIRQPRRHGNRGIPRQAARL